MNAKQKTIQLAFFKAQHDLEVWVNDCHSLGTGSLPAKRHDKVRSDALTHGVNAFKLYYNQKRFQVLNLVTNELFEYIGKDGASRSEAFEVVRKLNDGAKMNMTFWKVV